MGFWTTWADQKASAAPLLPHPSSRDGAEDEIRADDEIRGHDEGRSHQSARGEMRGEERRGQHALEHSREHCNGRGEEKRQVRDPGCCDDQDPPEEGDQGREARDVRQSRPGEGEASKDHRQGFPRESPQGRVLRVSRSVASPARRLRVSFCPGWLEGTWSFMAFWSHYARRGRLYVLHIWLPE